MAESKKDEKKPKVRKKPEVKKTSTMREKSAKTRAKAEKPKRVRKVAGAAKRPFKAVGSALSKEFHLIGDENNDKFLTKSRKATPGYFKSAWAELKQVTWPGRKETWKLVFAVFVFAIMLGTVIAVIDYGLEKLLREIIL